ncbi:hypothetical protein ILUMI_02265 [Ignelater luminosus]|uniref:DUF659 domain-containing protein n=1 Tax=Ignelater luminosus TaxID=2038154 RepID=A0A8K0DGT4_IGNLU|nr:hypothetical protein ILUMI_02265 [Ignelater luminosus]
MPRKKSVAFRYYNLIPNSVKIKTSSVSTAATDLLSPSSQSVVNKNLLNSSSTPTSKSSVLLFKFVDCTTADETDEIRKLLAMTIYATDSPLNVSENKYWINFFKQIRPLQLPSHHNLSSTLLQNMYNNVQLQVQNSLANAYVVGIQCDGWSNIRNKSIINFIITTPQQVFYKTISTEEHHHRGQYVAEQIEAVFTDIGINKVIAWCTDNAANMKKVLAKHLSNVDENKVLENLTNFRSNSGFWEMQFVQDSAINPNISPVTFWKGICTEFPLRFVAEEIKIVPNNDKSLDFFGYKGNDKLLEDATDTSESTVTLGLEEKTMATNQSEPGFSG